MTTRTRYFVITSLLVLFVGVGTGLVAFYVGFPGAGLSPQTSTSDLQLLPRDSTLVAFANVREVMRSELREKIRSAVPATGAGQQELQEQTGINVETDIDQVLVAVAPAASGQRNAPPLLVLARGIFDTSRIEGLMRSHGAHVEEYKGVRLIVAPAPEPPADSPIVNIRPSESFAVAFVDTGLVAIGNTTLLRAAVDQKGTGPGVTGNTEMMNLVKSFDGGHAWAVGHFEALASQTQLPTGLAGQLPPITWFAANAQVDSGIRANLRADTRDREAAENLREIVRGVIALVKLQTASQPELKVLLDSMTLGGTDNTVSLGFDLPGPVLDRLISAAGMLQHGPEILRK